MNFASIYRTRFSHYRHYLYEHQPNVPRLVATYTFGAPRIGTGEIWRAIIRPHYRLIVRGDPVPRTPPTGVDDFQAAFLEKPSKAAKQPTSTPRKIMKALWSMKPSLIPDFGAHDIEAYIEAIKCKIKAKR